MRENLFSWNGWSLGVMSVFEFVAVEFVTRTFLAFGFLDRAEIILCFEKFDVSLFIFYLFFILIKQKNKFKSIFESEKVSFNY